MFNKTNKTMGRYNDNEISDNDIKQIGQLYELRHYSNVMGDDYVASKLRMSTDRFDRLKYSDLNGRVYIDDLFKCSDKSFNDKFNQLIDEEEEKQNNIYLAQLKNDELIEQLHENRTEFLGIGTRKIKIRLNKLSKDNIILKVIRLMMEIEDVNIQAKETYGKYRDRKYKMKVDLIIELIDIYKENSFRFGYHDSDVHKTNYIIFFEIPNTDIQVSWHSDLSSSQMVGVNKYDKVWDGLVNSTMIKLENYLKINYHKDLVY